MLTSLSLDGLRSKFAEAIGTGKSRVQQSFAAKEPLEVSLWSEESWVDGKAIVELEKIAQKIKFQVIISPAQDNQGAVRIEMKGKLQVCFYSEEE